MHSLRHLYKIGPGPSSSHTIGPKIACEYFAADYPQAHSFEVTLYGSLSLTGKGHLTDKIIEKSLSPKPVKINFIDEYQERHPNAMDLIAYDKHNNQLAKWRVYSVGGGHVEIEGSQKNYCPQEVYPFYNTMGMRKYLSDNSLTILDAVNKLEGDGFREYMTNIVRTMLACVDRGLEAEGIMAGEMQLERVAKKLHTSISENLENIEDKAERVKMLVASYAYAVSEENATGGTIVTAPTCGASGIVPAILYYFHHHQSVDYDKLTDALAVGGMFGNIIKHNATISGAEGGCQAECGAACSMAAAAAAFLMGLTDDQIEYSAEVALEHHLGLTCDPVLGEVQVPCIERNAVMALRAYDCALFGKHIGIFRKNRISFDCVVAVMKEAGDLLNTQLKETSIGGLARSYREGCGRQNSCVNKSCKNCRS